MAEIPTNFVTVTFSPQSSVAFFLKGILECAGLTVAAAASNATDLVALAERVRPDAIVYDVSFPFSSNWQALQEVRSCPSLRGVPVVVTTSERRELSRATGCSTAIEIFARPDNVTVLRQALRSAIEAIAPGHAA